jgi:hypothetical protein
LINPGLAIIKTLTFLKSTCFDNYFNVSAKKFAIPLEYLLAPILFLGMFFLIFDFQIV